MRRHFPRKSAPRRTPPPSQERMGQMLSQSGIQLNREQLDQLWRYHNLLRKRNQDRDLTRIIHFEAMVVKHYVDCMIVGKFVTLPSPILDIGTGAGFPGIPLKIRYPHLRMTLAEPRPRRVDFLKEAVKELGLKHVDVFDHKVVSRSFQKPVAGVITRALETIDKTLLRTTACVGQGGLILFMKGPNCDLEIKDVAKRFPNKYKLVVDEAYNLPHTEHQRRLIGFEKLVPAELPKGNEPEEKDDLDIPEDPDF